MPCPWGAEQCGTTHMCTNICINNPIISTNATPDLDHVVPAVCKKQILALVGKGSLL